MKLLFISLAIAVVLSNGKYIHRKKEELTSLFDQLEDDVNSIINHEKEIKKSIKKSAKKNNHSGSKKHHSEIDVDLKHGILTDILKRDGEKRDAGATVTRWPSVNGVATVPYTFDSTITAEKRQKIVNSITYMNDLTTAVQWVERTSEPDYARFQSPDNAGCSSYVGKIGGAQEINIGDGCEYKGIISHEMLHCLGFFHEQSRPDRDEYVKVNLEKVPEGVRGNFEKLSWSDVVKMNSNYDYGSLMHYGLTDFSTDGTNVLEPLKPYTGEIGQRNGLSDEDIRQLKIYYGETGTTGGSTASPSTQTTESPSGQTTESPSVQTTESPSEQTTEAPSEQTTESPSEQTTESPSEQTTESPSEQTTEAPFEQTTESPSEQTTESPSEHTTEAPSEQTTESPSEHTTEEPVEQTMTVPSYSRKRKNRTRKSRTKNTGKKGNTVKKELNKEKKGDKREVKMSHIRRLLKDAESLVQSLKNRYV